MTKKHFLIRGIIILMAALVGCSGSAPMPETPLHLSLQDSVEVSLPPGDHIYQDGERVLFLGSFILEHPPKTVVAFSLRRKQQEWVTSLPASPIQALSVGDAYLIATIPSETSNEAYVLALDALTGQQRWSQPLGQAMVALASDAQGRIWVAWEEGVSQLNPETGVVSPPVIKWESAASYGKHRTLAIWSDTGETYLAVTTGRRVFLYREEGKDWRLVWNFQSGGRVLELHPLAEAGSIQGWLILAHSYAYGVSPTEGQTTWRVNNSDNNLDAQQVRCAEGTVWGFGNVMGHLYLVNHQQIIHEWKLPGGNIHMGPIPLPFPEHPVFGLSAADLNGDGEDELIVRSLKEILVFDCHANLLATASVESSQGKMVAQLRQSRLHRPAIWDQEVVVASRDGVLYLSLAP